MDDQTIDLLTEQFSQFVLQCALNPSSTTDSDPNMADEACERDNVSAQLQSSDYTDENSMCNGVHEVSSYQGHTLPILKKVIDLSTKVQNLKMQHLALSDQVKLTNVSFPGQDVLKSVQLLGAEYECLKRKYQEESSQRSAEYECLKRKYLKESSERRRLYNELIELKGNIRVFCRCRPLNENENANGSASVVKFESSPDELQIICSDSSKKQFKFDHVFRPEDSQEAVFAQTKPVVTSVLDGFNVCIFAYGQTGTGKTFTMEGTMEHRGVNYRTLEELFRISEERHGIMKYELLVSMLEVYNEKIKDLLAESSAQPTKRLEIKQAAEGTQEVPGLVEARVYGTEDVWELLKSGNRVRSVGSTSANELSSRSHCLLRVTVKGENLINGQRTKSHLWLVDLAGSERVGKTEAEGERLKESQFINKSLSALGDVISALASKSAHIPYRNSKLTHILQSSLGGDCKTLMFVQISPSTADIGETLCSLNFATRVRGIESGPARKQADLTELFKYKQMAEKFKHDEKETKKLQDNVQTLELRLATREHMYKNLQEKVRDLENQIAEERKARLKQESRSLTAAAASAQPSTFSSTAQKAIMKPPLNPLKRPPLRGISNCLPPPPSKRKPSHNTITSSYMNNGKENLARTTSMTTNTENLARTTSMTTSTEGTVMPRRRGVSIAVRPPPPPVPPTTTRVILPKRRVSIAIPSTSESSTTTRVIQPKRRVSVATTSTLESSRYSRKARYSRLFAPLPEMSSSKFKGSPTQADSQVPRRNLAVVALQRKSLVWSPLKLRNLKNSRNSKEMQ